MNRILRRLVRAGLSCMLAGAALAVHAHKASDAYLHLRDGPDGTVLRVDVALRDLDALVDLDHDGDGRLTWGEVKAAWPAIEAEVRRGIGLDGCVWQVAGHALERRSDGAYAVLHGRSSCRLAQVRGLSYGLMRDVDPTHRGIARIDGGTDLTRVLVLDPSARAPVALPAANAAQAPGGFFREGVHHIVTGYDHLLFLLCLLLPAVLRREAGPGRVAWRPVESAGQALWPVAGIVTAFTLAHSITLGLAATGWISLPASFIEPAIAVTIVLAAIDNLRPIFHGRRALVTFVFGLIHGFGFAGVLGELALPPVDFAWALLRFNLGLEAGQLAIVLAATAVLYGLRSRRVYAAWIVGGGSTAAALVGVGWFVERVAEVSLLPF